MKNEEKRNPNRNPPDAPAKAEAPKLNPANTGAPKAPMQRYAAIEETDTDIGNNADIKKTAKDCIVNATVKGIDIHAQSVIIATHVAIEVNL